MQSFGFRSFRKALAGSGYGRWGRRYFAQHASLVHLAFNQASAAGPYMKNTSLYIFCSAASVAIWGLGKGNKDGRMAQ